MSEVNFGMKDSNSKRQFKKPMQRDSLARMLAVVDMTLMSMLTEVLVHTSAEKNQLSSNLLRVSQEDQD